MPNWCNNQLNIRHDDPEMIKKAAEAANKDELFNTFAPRQEAEYGVNVWGTKWEPSFYEEATIFNPNELCLGFDTAWSPPIAFYDALCEQGFTVEAYYFEPGLAFCGMYSDGQDDEISIDCWGEEWIKENIPEELDDMFNISGFAEDAED